jgi:hypothetical protein
MSTCVVIITVRWRGADTCGCGTGGHISTRVPIIARSRIGGEDTIAAVARVISAWIPVIARDRGATGTLTIHAAILGRTGIPIVTQADRDGMVATSVSQTRVIRARIPVIADETPQPNTVTVHATVPRGAAILIVAIARVGAEYATQTHIAAVVSAWIAILTVHGCTRRTCPCCAHIPQRTQIPVITGLCVV